MELAGREVGVPEHWVVNLAERVLVVLREPENGSLPRPPVPRREGARRGDGAAGAILRGIGVVSTRPVGRSLIAVATLLHGLGLEHWRLSRSLRMELRHGSSPKLRFAMTAR